MTCIVSDHLTAVGDDGSIVGLAGRPIIAVPTNIPLWVSTDGRITWLPLQGNELRTYSDENGNWSLPLHPRSELDPNITDWQIVYPDGTIWGGTIPESVPSATMAQLKNQYSWGLVDGGSPVTIVTSSGPQGPAGINWRGAWVSGTSYALNDAVYYQGSSYLCTTANSDAVFTAGKWATLASQGSTGPTGAAGPTVNWRGPWTISTQYNVNDAVSYNGSSYLCTVANSDATFTSSKWAQIAAQGGVGPSGQVAFKDADALWFPRRLAAKLYNILTQTVTVLCMGDSITYGANASDPHTQGWPYLLAQWLGTQKTTSGATYPQFSLGFQSVSDNTNLGTSTCPWTFPSAPNAAVWNYNGPGSANSPTLLGPNRSTAIGAPASGAAVCKIPLPASMIAGQPLLLDILYIYATGSSGADAVGVVAGSGSTSLGSIDMHNGDGSLHTAKFAYTLTAGDIANGYVNVSITNNQTNGGSVYLCGLIPYVNTVASSGAPSGSTFTVVSTSAITAGVSVTFDYGTTNEETLVVSAVNTGTTFTTTAAPGKTHTNTSPILIRAGYQLHRLGHSGAAAADYSASQASQSTSYFSPDLVIVELGINDLSQQNGANTARQMATTIVNSIYAIAGQAALASADVAIYGTSMPPSSTDVTTGGYTPTPLSNAANWPTVIAELRKLCAMQTWRFLSIYDLFGQSWSYAATQGWQDGTVHPTTAGHAQIAALVETLFPVPSQAGSYPAFATQSNAWGSAAQNFGGNVASGYLTGAGAVMGTVTSPSATAGPTIKPQLGTSSATDVALLLASLGNGNIYLQGGSTASLIVQLGGNNMLTVGNATVTIGHGTTGTLAAQSLIQSGIGFGAGVQLGVVGTPSNVNGPAITPVLGTSGGPNAAIQLAALGTGNVYVGGNGATGTTYIYGNGTQQIQLDSGGTHFLSTVGFYGATPVSKQAITGALSTVTDAAAKAVLTSILAAFTSIGLFTNSTT